MSALPLARDKNDILLQKNQVNFKVWKSCVSSDRFGDLVKPDQVADLLPSPWLRLNGSAVRFSSGGSFIM
jgi:hypothetical protein